MALAIELAAARVPSLGLDGLEAGLADRLRLLTGGPRIDDRHRSLRSALDWSYALLDETDQAVLRRVSVFAAPFTAAAAAAVPAGWPPVPGGRVHAVLAGLADQSLLVAIAGRRRHSLPRPGDHPAVRRRAARPRRASRTRRSPATCAGAWRSRWPDLPGGGGLGPAGGFDLGGRRAAGRAGLGGRPARAAAPRRTGWPSGWPS